MSASPSRPPRAGRSSKIGQSVLRVEDDRLLRGRAAFIDDIDPGYGVLHVAFLRSQYAHARIARLDTAAARMMPSVAAVLTAVDLPHIAPLKADFDKPGFVVAGRPVLASERVRFVGDAIAMVVADDPYAALDAVEEIEIEYEPLPEVTEAQSAIEPGAPLVFDHVPNNVIYEGAFESSGFSQAHADAEFRLKERFSAARIAAAPIEPRGCVATYQKAGNGLTLWSSTQSPHLVRSVLAQSLAIGRERYPRDRCRCRWRLRHEDGGLSGRSSGGGSGAAAQSPDQVDRGSATRIS